MDDITDTTLAPDSPRIPRGAPTQRAQLYVVFYCENPRRPTARHALHDVDTVLIGRGESGWSRNAESHDRRLVLRLHDPFMSSVHVRLSRAMGRWLLEDAPSKNGTVVNGALVAPGRKVALEDGDRTYLVERSYAELVLPDHLEPVERRRYR